MVLSLKAAKGLPTKGSGAGPSNQDLLRQIAEQVASVKDQLTGLSGLPNQVASIQDQVTGLAKAYGAQQELLGALVEASSRQRINDMFGGGYEKPLLARSLQDSPGPASAGQGRVQEQSPQGRAAGALGAGNPG
jgi:hypothetical protein